MTPTKTATPTVTPTVTAVPAWGPVFFGGAAYGTNSTSFTKSSGTDGWNTKVYSTTSYTGGVSVTAQSLNPPNTAAFGPDIMFGLSTNPASTANVNAEYVNIDYGWFLTGASDLRARESGADIGSFGAFTSSTVCNITYDGANVRYYKDGVLQRTVQRDDLRSTPLYFISTSYYVDTSNRAITNVAFVSAPSVTPTPSVTVTPTRTVTPSLTPSLTATPSLTPTRSVTPSLTPTKTVTPTVTPSSAAPSWGPVFFGNAAYGGSYTSFAKTSGSEAWDSKVYSTTSFTGGASVAAQCNTTNNADIMVGLSTNPASTANVNAEYININYGWFPTAPTGYTGLDIYESGTYISSHGVYTASTVFSITYDGANVRYYKDGVVVRTVLNTALRNTPLYFMTAFYHADATRIITDVAFVSIPSVTPTPTVTPTVTRTVTPSVTQSHT